MGHSSTGTQRVTRGVSHLYQDGSFFYRDRFRVQGLGLDTYLCSCPRVLLQFLSLGTSNTPQKDISTISMQKRRLQSLYSLISLPSYIA